MVPSACCLWEGRPPPGPGPLVVTAWRHFQNLFYVSCVNLFRMFFLMWWLGLPVAILWVCFLSAMQIQYLQEIKDGPGLGACSCSTYPSQTGQKCLALSGWHHPLHNEGKYVLEVLWRGSYVAVLSPHGFLWRCLPVAMRGWHVPVPDTSLLGPALRRKCRLLVSFRNMWEWYYTDQLGHLFSIWQLTAGHLSHCQPWALPRQDRTLVWHPPAEARAGCEGAWLEVGGNFWFSGAF